jgi:septum formation protein
MISEHLNKYQVILASKSPRRALLLKELGLKFEVGHIAGPAEVYPEDLSNTAIAQYLAELKASVYAEEIKDSNKLVITADTIVCTATEVLGKPGGKNEAIEMLHKLSGRQHAVITGVTIMSNNKKITFAVSTKVYFKHLSSEEINYYIDTYKPFDKAGAYGIQEWIGMTGIEKIEGSYFNVVGLPVQKLYTELLKF